MKAFLGIDPGKSGGMAVLCDDGHAECFPFESEADVLDALKAWKIRSEVGDCRIEVAIEKVGGYVGRPQSGAMMFTFGDNAGFWRGAISALCLPFRYVRPQVWQTGLDGLAKLDGADRKRRLRDLARQRYPQLSGITLATADAVLIADWLKHQP